MSKYQRPSVVMNINETCKLFKESSVRSSIPGMFERNKLYEGCGICRILTIKWKKTPGDCNIKTGDYWCCLSKICYISIDIHAYMFQYLQNN